MFRKFIATYLLLAVTAVGTGSVARMADAAPLVRTTDSRSLPAAPTAPVQGNLPAPLSTSQMSALKGDGPWGWIKKMWNKYKKKIIKIIWEVIKEIIDSVVTETQEQSASVSGTVTEYYSGNDETTEVYASQADYEASNVQSSSYADYGYQYQYSDTSAGYYEY